MAPLGFPVVPEVKMIVLASDGSMAAARSAEVAGSTAAAPARKSDQATAPSGTFPLSTRICSRHSGVPASLSIAT